MHFPSAILALLASAAAVSASSVTFWTLDDAKRTIYFTPNAGFPNIEPVTCDKSQKLKVNFPDKWIGNFYAVQKGQENKPGMLGEVNFNSWGGMTFFDVSAIVDPSDKNNVKQMWPASGPSPMSGCETFPCNNAYWLFDDVQTKVTHESDLITTLGTGSTGIKFAELQ
ncbi:DNase1 protein [Moelleriella libera RCEF 2490]|uniref:DNase1 protein n=1 Tax=Moelleriella libera RCEF 2490 TaxID=1081109 RepID=A0A168CGJ7_9HYPO|nr:DNase1 protein [Moelleriella libera RCEF 2490]